MNPSYRSYNNNNWYEPNKESDYIDRIQSKESDYIDKIESKETHNHNCNPCCPPIKYIVDKHPKKCPRGPKGDK